MLLVVERSMYSVFLLVFIYQGILTSPQTLKGHINNDLVFYYREFTTFPSMEATIEYSITYNYTAAQLQCSLCYPRLDIYTTKSDPNLDRNCSLDTFGQLRNENLHTPLRPRHKMYRFTSCIKDADFAQNGNVHCRGKTKILDYTPRNYAFSFGFRCEQLETEMNRSMRGLRYTMTINNQTNTTQCYSMDPVHEEPRTRICAEMYSHMSLPNLVGSPDWKYLLDEVLSGTKLLEILLQMSPHVFGKLERCYPYFYELICYVLLPKCDPETKRALHPCKEMCEDLREGCMDSAMAVLKVLAAAKQTVFNWTVMYNRDPSTWFHCDYLPSKNSTIPCIYKPVICKPPPNITNAVRSISNGNGTHHALSTVNYSCESDEFRLVGNNTVTCKYSGEWSELPQCVEKTVTPLLIVLPILIFPLIVFVVILIRYTCLGKRQLFRNKEFDAFVCFDFNTDCEYVTDVILPELEENHDPPLKVCFHSRDFKPGIQIKNNINEAVRNSNSAIIVLSQGFVNSIWCREEFADCYIENMKDPAFRLFVILTTPATQLENISEFMKSFFDRTTYLLREDAELFQKIGKYLDWVKKPKDAKTDFIVQEGCPEIEKLMPE